jgi:tetratricopeptide (TPR) repeat protein
MTCLRATIPLLSALLVLSVPLALGENHGIHGHPAPQNLGVVFFPTTCKPNVQHEFERGVALLHSFAYSAAEGAFRDVSRRDPNCAMAHWGVAMTYFHELWDPPISASDIPRGQKEIELAQQLGGGSNRERRFISALALYYAPGPATPGRTRVSEYERAMKDLAAANPEDTESQVFYALALLASASPFEKSHSNQKGAVAILTALFRKYPRHPGIAHYLIHACDNQEMAEQGLPAARMYSKIAPSAPHALHMPSHVFTRLGMWDDSIASNLAASAAARKQGDIGEELHAMDYLVYAYLQEGRERKAGEIVRQVEAMRGLDLRDFKIAYASVAMPVRYMAERNQWAVAANTPIPKGTPPHVTAIAVWARAVGLAKTGRLSEARKEAEELGSLEKQLRASGWQYGEYWARQVEIQRLEALAWTAQAEKKADEARALLRKAADQEDSAEKLPVTPGPIIPAREQLGDLLLEQNQPKLAQREFRIALANAPNRRRATLGLRRSKPAA